MGNAVTVSPLANGEAIVSQRAQSRRNAATAASIARSATRTLAACGLETRAATVTRFGYVMVVVATPATGARRCISQG
jgi:hypothetical protein